MVLKLYFSMTSGNVKIVKEQQRIEMILKSKNYDFEVIDIAACEADKEKMRTLIGKPDALAPQLFNEDTYLGDFEKFEEAVEAEDLDNFLQVTSTKS